MVAYTDNPKTEVETDGSLGLSSHQTTWIILEKLENLGQQARWTASEDCELSLSSGPHMHGHVFMHLEENNAHRKAIQRS